MTSLSETSKKSDLANIIPIREASNAELDKLSREGMLSLSSEEMKAIQHYFQNLGRDPFDIELETLAQTWSEHCVHKTFKAEVDYTEDNNTNTHPLGTKNFSNLLKETIVAATDQMSPRWCLSVFKDNAGIIEFDSEDAVAFKVETHNHPSALEPYGGAGTGVGGVIRDILGCGLGAKPVLNTDVFCFGPLDTKKEKIPEGALSPKRIARGVVAGVRDYGNRMGIPTANGTVYFDEGYVGNPLVFCGTVGIIPRDYVEKTVNPGDYVVALGGRTGRDGIHGATFSSAPLESGITSSVVQIGHAIMEKKTMDVLLQARNKNLYRSVTDCGAGGFSSAVGELGKDTGVEVNLEKAPLKYNGLKPWEIWISESQERMVLAVPPESLNSLQILCNQENVECVVIGQFTDTKKLIVKYENDVLADLDMEFLHEGLPKRKLQAVWNVSEHRNLFKSEPINPTFSSTDFKETLLALIRHPNISSKEKIVRQYDHEVQGGSIIKPFMGIGSGGPTDACVFRPKFSTWKGVGISNGINPEMGKWDPYLMAFYAIDEAYRNLLAVGGGLSKVAILDNFCWGHPTNKIELAGLVRAAEACREAALLFQIPFISGKDSFNNTWRDRDQKIHSIPPTLLISAIGVIDDVRQCISPTLKNPGHLIGLVGITNPGWAGSLARTLWNHSDETTPAYDLVTAKTTFKKIQTAMKHNLIESCHDISEGGAAVAGVEMAFGSPWGISWDWNNNDLDLSTLLFSESPSRFLIEVKPENKPQIEETLGPRSVAWLGDVSEKPSFVVRQNGTTVIDESINSLLDAWRGGLDQL